MPKVSVIIPSYNSEKVVPLTIESALAQTFTDIEVIVVDDGSTDGTRQALARFGDHIRYIYQENKERSSARNTGIKAAQGEYLAFLDSDDLWLPEKIERQVAILESHPGVVLVCCDARFIDLQGNPTISRGQAGDTQLGDQLRIGSCTRELFMGNSIPGGGSSALVRHSALIQAGMFDEAIFYGEDWDTWMRLSYLGDFAYLPEALVRFRVSGWERVLRREASNDQIKDPMRILEKACTLWKGDAAELAELYQQGVAMLWQRAALASYQMGFQEQGREQFKKMISAYPIWESKPSLLNFAIDRAVLIYREQGDMEPALKFLHAYSQGLPENLHRNEAFEREAVAWLYLALTRDEFSENNPPGAKKLWQKAVSAWPSVLKNRGVLSLGIRLWGGEGLLKTWRLWTGKSKLGV